MPWTLSRTSLRGLQVPSLTEGRSPVHIWNHPVSERRPLWLQAYTLSLDGRADLDDTDYLLAPVRSTITFLPLGRRPAAAAAARIGRRRLLLRAAFSKHGGLLIALRFAFGMPGIGNLSFLAGVAWDNLAFAVEKEQKEKKKDA